MPKASVKRTINCSKEDLMNLVLNIEDYPKFIPYCLNAKIYDKKLQKHLIEKASITINGVSLTLSKVSKKYFELNIIPHTLKLTNLKNLKLGNIVNVELDIFGKYIYKYTI